MKRNLFIKTRRDTVKIKGVFTLFVVKNGILIEYYKDKNLVVDLGRNAVAALISNIGSSNKYLAQIGFGTSSTPPAPGDISLTGAYIKNIDAITLPVTGTVRINFSLGTAEANGITIVEYGLICHDATLFSRKTRAPITKDVNTTFTGTWDITF